MRDRELLDEIYERSLPRLGAYGFSLTGSYSAAEELVQAAIVKTFSKRRRYRDLAAAEAYVRSAIRTLHIDGIRRQARWTAAASSLVADDQVSDHAPRVDSDDAVNRALATLPPRVRTAVALRYVDDMTVADIAHAMGTAEGTIKRYLSEGRESLATTLGVPVAEEPETVQIKEARR